MNNGDIKSHIGRKSSVRSFEVAEARLREFCEAVGGKYRGEAPPTFMTVFREGEFELFDTMGIALKSVLHADQEFRYEMPLVPGDRVEYQTEVTKAFEKRGSSGPMRFIVFETQVKVARARGLIITGASKTTVIVR